MKHNLHILGLLLCLLFMAGSAGAQSTRTSVSGKVLDSATGETLIGVHISIIEADHQGTITDIDGNYTLQIPAGLPKNPKVKASYIGFNDVIIPLSDLIANPDITMSVDNETLEEVVVVGYGVQKKASSVGSITQAKGEDLQQSGNVNTVSEALQGRLNGVIALNSTGQPGDNSASIYIRGKSTWQNTDPLVLVDGIERDMNDVDFNEIESVSVLKDASATAVYGVRGGNGVILLTTKRGTLEKPTVNFSTNFGFKQPTASLSWADNITSMKAYNEAAANDKAWDNLIPQSTFDAWENAYATGNYGPYNDVFPEVDWYRQLIHTAVSQNYNVNVNGKSKFMKYFASVGYQKDGSIYDVPANDNYDPRSWYRRLNWRANFDFSLTPTTDFSINVAGKMGTRNSQQYPYIFKLIVQAPVNEFPIKYSDGYWGDATVRGSNVVANLYHGGQYTYNSFQGWYDVKLTQRLSFITEGLSAHASVSYNAGSTSMDTLRDGGFFGGNDNASKNLFPMEYRKYDYSNPITNPDGSITYPVDKNNSGIHQNIYYEVPNDATYGVLKAADRRLYYEIGINYARDFQGGHNLTAMALMNRQKIEESNLAATLFDFPQFTEDWVGRVTYNWNERYLTEFNISYTGSEKFAPGKRFGLFPSFSVGWRVTEEPWMARFSNVISNMKIRYSWGKVGNDRGASRFQYVQIYNQINGTNFGKDGNTLWGPGYTEGVIAQPNATWETSVKQDLGIEMSLWKKLRIEADLYAEHRSGILLSPRTTAPWVGVSIASANLGETKSHGVDLQLSWNDNLSQDFHYAVDLMFSTSENRIIFKDDPANYLDYERDAGKPIGYQKRYTVSGNYETLDDIYNTASSSLSTVDKLIPGDFAYIDFNADGVIDSKDMMVMKYMNYPLTTFSLNLSFDWKGLGFSALLYAPLGQYKLVPEDYAYDFPGGFVKAQPQVDRHWTEAKIGSESVSRSALHLYSAHNEQDNTWMYVNHSYLRLKTLEVNYKLPKRWQESLSMTKCTVFVSGNNLYTWWKGDKRIDPETGGQNVYPIVKTYTVGARFSF